MAKKTEFKKSELLQVLSSSTATLKEKNKAVKLLKKFDPNPKKHLDASFQTSQATVSKYPSLQNFLCWRCDKIKQTMTKVKWESKEGLKIICTTCYSNLAQYLEVAKVRRLNNKF